MVTSLYLRGVASPEGVKCISATTTQRSNCSGGTDNILTLSGLLWAKNPLSHTAKTEIEVKTMRATDRAPRRGYSAYVESESPLVLKSQQKFLQKML